MRGVYQSFGDNIRNKENYISVIFKIKVKPRKKKSPKKLK